MTTEGARKTPTSSAPGSSPGQHHASAFRHRLSHAGERAHGLAVGIREQCAAVLEAADAARSERFIRAESQLPALPTAVWINAPTKEERGSVIPDPRCLIGLDRRGTSSVIRGLAAIARRVERALAPGAAGSRRSRRTATAASGRRGRSGAASKPTTPRKPASPEVQAKRLEALAKARGARAAKKAEARAAAGSLALALGESAQVAAAASDDAGVGLLGKREAEVARLVADGLSSGWQRGLWPLEAWKRATPSSRHVPRIRGGCSRCGSSCPSSSRIQILAGRPSTPHRPPALTSLRHP